MEKESYIIVTGAAGFIGSAMVQQLNEKGFRNLILVDDFGIESKRKNWERKAYAHIVERYNLFDWLTLHEPSVSICIHLGARTDTTEFDYAIHEELNVNYSKAVWNYCVTHAVPLIYASSAATYGLGELGYNDDHAIVEQLKPLNPYGVSKNEFDKWALQQSVCPPYWAGLKFFNVYGPNEYHKGRMASVIWHAYRQIQQKGFVQLFKSHKPDYQDGEQLRDFVYVKDVMQVMDWMREGMTTGVSTQWKANNNGMYNLGTGEARTFNDLVKSYFRALNISPQIQYIDMPEDIRDRYQYYTEANMQKLRNIGYTPAFYALEAGVKDYLQHYLVGTHYL